MKKFFVSLSLFLIISNLSLQAQDRKLFENIQDSIFRQMELYPQEKIHLHTDRDIYVPGEKIWFKAYVTDAYTHRFPVYSRYVYVELIDSRDSLINRVMILQEKGMFCGQLFISDLIPEGDYTIRAYTRFMENQGDDYFFKKNIRIGNLLAVEDDNKKKEAKSKVKDDYDVSFFPEGGNLLEGVFCRVAFKALNISGSSETINGEIVDGDGNGITVVKTVYAGMGSFIINTERGKKYFLECRNSKGIKKRFKLPDTYAKGYSINTIWNEGRRELFVSRNRAVNSPDVSQYLLIHSKGLVLFFSRWDKNKEYITFKKEQIPAGIIQILLLDDNFNPLSERLVFNKMKDPTDVIFSTDKKVYEKRDLVSSTIELSGLDGNYSGGNFSVAITDSKDVQIDSLNTIVSSMLLSSELRGYIETPAYYLQDNRFASYALDHLMMTHGWRRYNIPEVIKGKMEIPEKPSEISKEITGIVKSLFLGKPVESAEVTVMTSAGDILQTVTNEKGEFSFANFEVPDSVKFFVQSLNEKGKPNIEIVVNEEEFPHLKHIPYHKVELVESVERAETGKEEYGFMEKAEQRAKYDEDMMFVQLKEVEVTAKMPGNKNEARLRYWGNLNSDITLRREDIEKKKYVKTVDVLRTISGVTIVDGAELGTYYIYLRRIPGSRPALIIIDGVVIDDEEIAEALRTVSFSSEIESIDVIKGAGASAFGVRGTDGAISITTRVGGGQSSDYQMPNFAILSPLGYQEPAEFYSPKYDDPNTRYLGNQDYRTTIFWKPDIIINEDKKAHFEFYTSDFATTYSVVIEGMTTDGRIIRQVENIEVK